MKANFLNIFEERVGAIFGAAPQGFTAPFSFKKLAKKAAHEMENETFVINGVDTAPALYTILVSPDDDQAMRPLYPQITTETSQFVEGQAQQRGYAFVGKPLVRFMVDPSLRSGKFSVFAENVDVRTLNRLHQEEEAYLGVGGVGGAAALETPVPNGRRQQARASVPSPAPLPRQGAFQDSLEPLDNMDRGLDVLPHDMDDLSVSPDVAPQSYQQPVVASEYSDSFPVTPSPVIPAAAAAEIPQTPATQRRANPTPLVDPYRSTADAAAMGMAAGAVASQAAPQAQAQQAPATCLLIDRQSGRTYTVTAPRTIVGRERSSNSIMLRDPNVSRRHAEISFDGRNWSIADLNSTNGTLVNDADVDECVLRDGDLITLGLINLEFREN